MAERPAGLPHDAAILLRYRWFVLAVFVAAIVGALAIGLLRSKQQQAQVSVEVRPTERQPVFGIRPLFSFGEYQTLASSDQVAKRAAGILAQQGRRVDPAALRAAVTVADTTPIELRAIGARQFEFTARDTDQAAVLAYADAWAKAYVDEGSAHRDSQVDAQIQTLDQQSQAAAADLDAKQLALDEFLRQHPDVAPVSPSDLIEERGRVTRALARLKAIQAQGGATPAELQIALSDVLPRDNPLNPPDLGTLIGGLGLRLNALNAEIAAFQAPNSNADRARQLFLAVDGAKRTYDAALGQASAARATKPVAPLEFRVPQAAALSGERRLGLVGLLAAAAAFGLAVGVVGAFAIDFLAREGLLPWGQRTRAASQRP